MNLLIINFFKMKRISLFFVAMCMMLSVTVAQSVWDGTHTIWTNGSGTETDPYLLENAAQLAYLAVYVNNGTEAVGHVVGVGKYWKLTADVDLNSLEWTPIGYYESQTNHYEFGGNFDGNWHTVANLVVSGVQYAGLFGRMNGGSMKNIGIIGNSSVSSSADLNSIAGGIVGCTFGSVIIENCYNTGDITIATISGGIVGHSSDNLSINNCYNTGNVSSSDYAGGIVGNTYTHTYSGTLIINNCYNTGGISIVSLYPDSYAGGIVG